MALAYVFNNQWMDEENVVHIHNRVLFSHKQEWNSFFFREMNGTRDHHVKQNKPDAERQILSVLYHIKYEI
jgi:hypothetical protein